MSQAPEVTTQPPLQDVKPRKDEILGGAGAGTGETGAGNDPINVKVRVLFIFRVDGDTVLSPGGFFFLLHRSRSLRPTVKRYFSRSNAPRSSPSFRVHTRTKSEKTSTASGAFLPLSPFLVFQRTVFLFFLYTFFLPMSLYADCVFYFCLLWA